MNRPPQIAQDGRSEPPEGQEPQNPIERAVADARAERAATDAGAAPAKRGRGRPPGSKTRNRSAATPAEPPPAEEYQEPTEAELAGVGVMWATLWRMFGRRGRVRPLESSEQLELAAASVPVIRKYAPAFDKYAAEVALGLVVVGMWDRTQLPPASAPPAEPAAAPAPPEPATAAA